MADLSQCRDIAAKLLNDPNPDLRLLAEQFMEIASRYPLSDGNWFPENENDLWQWGVRSLDRFDARIQQWLEPMIRDDNSAVRSARVYWVIRQLSTALGKIDTKLSELGNSASQMTRDSYEREGVGKSLTVRFEDTDYRVTTTVSMRASIRKGGKDAAFEWLRENNLGDLIVETVNAGTLSAAMSNMAEQNLEPPEEYFNTYCQEGISITKIR